MAFLFLDEKFFSYPLVAIPVRDHKEYSLPHTLVRVAQDYAVVVVRATRWYPVGTPEEYEKIQIIYQQKL